MPYGISNSACGDPYLLLDAPCHPGSDGGPPHHPGCGGAAQVYPFPEIDGQTEVFRQGGRGEHVGFRQAVAQQAVDHRGIDTGILDDHLGQQRVLVQGEHRRPGRAAFAG